MKRKILDRLLCLILLTLLICLAISARADSPLRARWFVEGFLPMCERIPEECAAYDDERETVTLTAERFALLDQVNRAVNREVTYQTDKEHYGKSEHFAYPTDGYGDCEDFALEKRRRLVAIGWPRRALLLAVVDKPLHAYQKSDQQRDTLEVTWAELHMILVVRTNYGNVVLDINHPDILPAYQTGYTYNWIQSSRDPKQFDPSPEILKFEKDWKQAIDELSANRRNSK